MSNNNIDCNSQSAAKARPIFGFEHRYTITKIGEVYDLHHKTYLKPTNNRVRLQGLNSKYYSIDVNKLLSKTFNIIDFTEFVPLKENLNYLINRSGLLYSTKRKKFITTTNKNGYLRYNVQLKNRLVHTVLATQFIDNPNNYDTVDHKDCNKLNNSLENLEWVSRSENSKRAWDNNLVNSKHISLTFVKDKELFTVIGLETAGKIFGITKSTLCTLSKRYGNTDKVIPSGSMKGYKLYTETITCLVHRLSSKEELDSSESEMVNIPRG